MICGTITNNINLPKPGSFDSSLAEAIRRLTFRCLSISKDAYFATGGGKGSPALASKLTSRTGRLRRSVNAAFEDGGKTGVVGTAVKYGGIHEFGGTFTAQRMKLKHAPHLAKRKNGEMAMTGSSYQITFPERSFLRAALKDLQPYVKPEIDAAVKKVIGL